MRDRLVISVSGKGGVGKTTFSALLSRVIFDKSNRSLLVVDADPVMNLPRALGVDVCQTVGASATELREKIDEGTLPRGATKQDMLEGDVFECLIEGDKYDFLAMGRTEGEGCYCYVNRILTQILDTLTKNYEITLMDMSAGLEHLSRRTDRNVDTLIIVVDPSRAAFEAALRIKELAKEVHIAFKRVLVVGNRFPDGMEEELGSQLEEEGLQLIGMIPNDDELAKFNYLGKPLTELPSDSKALVAVEAIAEKMGLLGDSVMLKLLGQES
jgi:CO dehydrogenase maturation factor